ncbi:ABC transporter substrate-binding protein [Thalassobius sp. Cn5-15]|uniref:ABC transporter substrate-binding protein n=1 Tax=Thalassobius sp. Cn5-15 TaxID=2917763 RepID=UPI001EF2DC4B|nr:ABC transporter substrate-binding protein [Thalassobius sp. Cn5-15]MCG7493181.1 polyamine ABC transporter substrate-binding protein [Thalassobius sp. Cn5-15]
MRSTLIAASALAISAGLAHAEDKTLYLAAYGGSTETLFKEVIIPAWQEKSGAKVVYVSGNSTDTLAKLRAQESAQEIDIAFIDDGPMTQAINFGYCDTVDEATFADLYDASRMPQNKAVGVGIVATGLAYNAEMFEKNGWAAPTSWADLADPKYKGKVAIPPITNGYGLHALIMAAKLNGGGETDIEPGFEMFQDKIDDNVLVYEPSSGKMSELFQNGEIALSVWGSGRLKSLADTGFPGAFAYPEEGAVNLLIAACPVVDSDVPELSQDFLKFITSAEMQQYFAIEKGWGPVNKNVALTDEQIGALPVGPERVDTLVNIDYTVVNEQRGAWTQKWTRQIER